MRPYRFPVLAAAILLAMAVVLLTGCDTLGVVNRVTCTVAKDKAYVVGDLGPVGIGAPIAVEDTAVICK